MFLRMAPTYDRREQLRGRTASRHECGSCHILTEVQALQGSKSTGESSPGRAATVTPQVPAQSLLSFPSSPAGPHLLSGQYQGVGYMLPPSKGSDKIQGSQARCLGGCRDKGGRGVVLRGRVGLSLLLKSSVPSMLPNIPIYRDGQIHIFM